MGEVTFHVGDVTFPVLDELPPPDFQRNSVFTREAYGAVVANPGKWVLIRSYPRASENAAGQFVKRFSRSGFEAQRRGGDVYVRYTGGQGS